MADVILGPAAAADEVCHEEQLRIWGNDMISAIGMENYLRKDLDYHDHIDLAHIVEREIKRIVQAAFDHPEAKTIKRSIFRPRC